MNLAPDLLAALRADPADGLTRAIAADWLDEHGEQELAENLRNWKWPDGSGMDLREFMLAKQAFRERNGMTRPSLWYGFDENGKVQTR